MSLRAAVPRLSRSFQVAPSATTTRAFTSSALRSKTITETVKETADAVNKKVGQTLAAGIEKGEQATASAKDTIVSNTPSSAEVEGKAEEARQSANHTLGKAAGKARDAKDEVEKKL